MNLTIKEIFTKQDIQKFGFVYEPDENKCRSICFSTHKVDIKDKTSIAKNIKMKCVHSISIRGSCIIVKGHGSISLL